MWFLGFRMCLRVYQVSFWTVLRIVGYLTHYVLHPTSSPVNSPDAEDPLVDSGACSWVPAEEEPVMLCLLLCCFSYAIMQSKISFPSNFSFFFIQFWIELWTILALCQIDELAVKKKESMLHLVFFLSIFKVHNKFMHYVLSI